MVSAGYGRLGADSSVGSDARDPDQSGSPRTIQAISRSKTFVAEMSHDKIGEEGYPGKAAQH
jgi:hypothetical protein